MGKNEGGPTKNEVRKQGGNRDTTHLHQQPKTSETIREHNATREETAGNREATRMTEQNQ